MDNSVDLNELCLASYNELVRIKFLEDKKLEELSYPEIYEMTAKLYEKLGDKFLEHTLRLDENGKPRAVEFNFNEKMTYIELIILFAICHINKMDLNLFFELKPKPNTSVI